jgi:hypothetical protein
MALAWGLIDNRPVLALLARRGPVRAGVPAILGGRRGLLQDAVLNPSDNQGPASTLAAEAGKTWKRWSDGDS